jgi:hypothetical protein
MRNHKLSFFTQSLVMAVLSVAVLVDCNVARAEQRPSPEQNAVELRKEKKPQIKEKPAGKPKAAKIMQNGTADAGKSGVTTMQSEKPQPELDRRWIIKMKDEKGKKTPPRKPVAIAWANKDQQTSCEAYLPGLQETFSKTRYYSVGGDGCNTAGSAGAFLDLVKACEVNCPQGFLESKGYSQQIRRNVEILHQLGKKKCVESTKETGAVKIEADKPRAR